MSKWFRGVVFFGFDESFVGENFGVLKRFEGFALLCLGRVV